LGKTGHVLRAGWAGGEAVGSGTREADEYQDQPEMEELGPSHRRVRCVSLKISINPGVEGKRKVKGIMSIAWFRSLSRATGQHRLFANEPLMRSYHYAING
jgi:hypothetical protein